MFWRLKVGLALWQARLVLTVSDFAAADIAALPYREIYQSGALLMAMSHGVPVIVSDLEAMKETVVDGETGFLFESESVASLAASLATALGDPAHLAAIGFGVGPVRGL